VGVHLDPSFIRLFYYLLYLLCDYWSAMRNGVSLLLVSFAGLRRQESWKEIILYFYRCINSIPRNGEMFSIYNHRACSSTRCLYVVCTRVVYVHWHLAFLPPWPARSGEAYLLNKSNENAILFRKPWHMEPIFFFHFSRHC
jgi:hypothetical protein